MAGPSFELPFVFPALRSFHLPGLPLSHRLGAPGADGVPQCWSLELIPLAGSSYRGAPPGRSDQADILTVYSAAEGKEMGHWEACGYTGPNFLAYDLE